MATYPIRQLADNGGTAPFVPVTAPEAVQFPDGSNLNTLIGSIATIESNPVAANHAVGEFLCINGQVYEVIDAITAGDSIALGENVQVANLGSQITALNNGLTVKSYELTSTTNSYGNADVPTNIVRPSTGAILSCVNDSNNKAFAPIGAKSSDKYILRFYNYASTSSNVVANTSITVTIYYILYI